MIRISLAALAIALPAAATGDALSAIGLPEWLAGRWCTAESPRGQTCEQWLPAAGGMMLGVSQTVRGGKTAEFEFLRIAMDGDAAVYLAQPGGKRIAKRRIRGIGLEQLRKAFSQLAGDLHDTMFPGIVEEFERTREAILEIKDAGQMLDGDYRLRLSIRLRNPYVDPISLLQADLLRRWREGDREDGALLEALVSTVNGIAAGIQNTG